jgi:hypothetical protein
MNHMITPLLKLSKRSSLVLAAGFALAAVSTGHAQMLLLSLQAANYNTSTGVWTDSSSNADNATVSTAGVAATLATGATPNGSDAVVFAGNSFFKLATGITAGNGATGYTAFVFAEPTSTADGSFFGGGGGSFQYRVVNGNQDVVQQGETDVGHGTATVSTTSFSLLDVTTSSASAPAFRLNGTADATVSGADPSFGNSIQVIGSNQLGSGENFTGDIADVEIYSGILTPTQIATEEAALTAEYVTPVPEPSTWAMALVGVGVLFGVQRLRTRKA